MVEAPHTTGKGSVYEGGVKVPFIISGPAIVNGGRESLALVHGVDLFATISELAGVDLQAEINNGLVIDGVSCALF